MSEVILTTLGKGKNAYFTERQQCLFLVSESYKLRTVWLLQPNSKVMAITNAFSLHLLDITKFFQVYLKKCSLRKEINENQLYLYKS